MKAMVVYDSASGNTRQIAEAICRALGADTRVYRPDVVDGNALKHVDLLVIGSPTYGGRPTEAIARMMDRILPALPAGISVAAFDTRLGARFVRLFGFAADRIAARFKEKGVRVAGAQGFFVKGRKGPLAPGETERAAAWAKQLAG